jgi:hypothetical protein
MRFPIYLGPFFWLSLAGIVGIVYFVYRLALFVWWAAFNVRVTW